MVQFSELKGKKFVNNLKIILKDLEPFIRAVKPLWNSPPFPNFSLRVREAWTLWLLCAALNRMRGLDLTFGEDDESSSDGILLDKRTMEFIKTENVATMDFPSTNFPRGEKRIIAAIMSKIQKGHEYAKGKILTVFFDGAHQWHRNKVREAINGKHHFEQIFLIGLVTDHNATEWEYSVTELEENTSTTFIVKITPDFTDWSVTLFPNLPTPQKI
ncbi:MAG: hypothetical protein PHU04_04300 [Candidatus Peribacteraceae bacterium]|nr:hypothetical protein [Candidatus Peribacteraceae bacterium]